MFRIVRPRPHRSRRRILAAGAAALIVLATGIGVASAEEPTYRFVKTGMWSFNPGATTPYVVTTPYLGSKGTPDNYRFAVTEYQRILHDDFGIGTTIDGVYGPATARSVAAFQARVQPQAAALGIDLGVRGAINANTAYLMVRPILQREAAAHGLPLGMLTCHAMLEGGFNLGAALGNGDATAQQQNAAWDLGPAQFSVKWNASRPIPSMFNADYAYNAMAAADGKALKRLKGNQLAAVYAWNSPTDARRVAQGAAPAGDGQLYLDWINRCRTTTAYGRD